MALPVATTKTLHTVQLSPQVRKILHKRAAAAERRAYAPILASDRAGYGEANRAYQLEKGSVKGASKLLENALTQALAGLGSSGLQGGYLKRTQNELVARQGDAAESIPYLLAGANEDRKKSILETSKTLREDRAKELSGSASTFNQLLKEARGAGSSELKSEETAEKSKHHEQQKEAKAAKKELGLADEEVNRLLEAYPEQIPSTKEKWAIFAAEVAKAEGVGIRAANEATKKAQVERGLKKVLSGPFG